MSARSASQSTILPLPSSPHWAPITVTLAKLQTFQNGQAALDRARGRPSSNIWRAAAALRGVSSSVQRRDRDPAVGAHRWRPAPDRCRPARTGGAGRRRRARHRRADRHRAKSRSPASSRPSSMDDRVAAAAADLAAYALGEQREAEPALIFEAVPLGRIERERRPAPISAVGDRLERRRAARSSAPPASNARSRSSAASNGPAASINGR